jgi:SAM-dependent methyltransferase
MRQRTVSNEAQIEFWNGEGGNKWAANQRRLDHALAPLGITGMETLAMAPGHQVLDVGCGCGATSIELAARGGNVTGVDISGPMLDIARARAATLPDSTVRFLKQDAAAVRYEQSFDRVFSRFGVMFFDDPVAAFTRIHSAVNVDGRMTFVCWRRPAENPWVAEPMGIVHRYVPPTAPPGDPHAPGPFAFADKQRIIDILRQSGFRNVNVEAHDAGIVIGERTVADAVDFIREIGPTSQLFNALDPGVAASLKAELNDLFAKHLGPAGVVMGAACWIVTAAP